MKRRINRLLNYKDDKCSYVGYMFHQALSEYLKDGGDADKLINSWRDYNKSKNFSDFPKIKKEEVELVKMLKQNERAKNGDIPLTAILPILAKCPSMTTDILCLMVNLCQITIDVKTLTVTKKEN